MTWTKLGAEFPPTARKLSDAAFRTHVEALAWSNFTLANQIIEKGDLRLFANTTRYEEAAAELVATDWWQDCGDSWFIGMRFADWQRDKVQVETQRARNAEEQRRSRRHKLGDHEMCLPTAKCRASAADTAPDKAAESAPAPEQNRTAPKEEVLRSSDPTEDEMWEEYKRAYPETLAEDPG